MKPILPSFLAVWILAAGPGQAATNDYFAEGLAALRAGDFSAAAMSLEQEVKRHPSSGALVNLGLAEWQRGRAGAAILAWERAQWLDPYGRSATQNLKFAREVAQVDAPEWRWLEVASMWLPPDAWVWLAGAGLWLAVGVQVVPRVFRWHKPGFVQWLTALGFGIFLFCLAANVGVVSRTQMGIVLKRNAPLLLTPTREGEVVSTLTAGEPARKLRTRGNYYFIRTPFGAGWVERSQLGLVCAPE